MVNAADFLLALASKTGVRNCPFCGTNNWASSNSLTTTIDVREINYQTAWFNAQIPKEEEYGYLKVNIPVVQLLCNTCGYVAHFNPSILLKEESQ